MAILKSLTEVHMPYPFCDGGMFVDSWSLSSLELLLVVAYIEVIRILHETAVSGEYEYNR